MIRYLIIMDNIIFKKCIICGKDISEKRLSQGKKTCSGSCQRKTVEFRQKRSDSMKKAWSNKEFKKKQSNCIKKAYQNLEVRQKISEKLKKAYQNPELRQKISKLVKDSITDEARDKISKRSINMWKDHDKREKIISLIKKSYQNPEVRQKISNSVKKAFKDHGNSMIEKSHNTKKKNGSYKKSLSEEKSYEILLTKFACDDIERQFFDRYRYPFNCDVYIKSLDLFIEFHYGWHHNNKPFINSEDDLRELDYLKEKAKTSKNYLNKIYQWTDLDVRKLETFKKNNLNYKIFYTMQDFIDWFEGI